MPLTTKVREFLSFELSKVGDVGSPAVDAELVKDLHLASGTDTVDKADQIFTDKRNLAASALEDLDLAGVLLDPLGSAFAPAEIVAIYVAAASSNTNNVVVGGAAMNPFVGPTGAAGTISIKPGEHALLTSKSGWGVVAGTGDLLRVANGGAGSAVDYTIILVGRSAAA